MKVIFLDNDGVICLSSNWGSRIKKEKNWMLDNSILNDERLKIKERPVGVRFDDFDKKAIKVLNQIILESGAEIVVSSDWKLYGSLEELGEYYESQGIIKKPIDVTRNLEEFDPEAASFYGWKNYRAYMRILEIEKYLGDHPEITSWVAVDDIDMSPESNEGQGLKNFVLTKYPSEGIKQSGISQKILSYFRSV